jgi:diguanylate cyclase (GGDEF)-like protein
MLFMGSSTAIHAFWRTFLLVSLLFGWHAAALANSLPLLDLSRIANQDISTQIAYFADVDPDQPLPADAAALASWLEQLPPSASESPADGSFLAAVRLHNDGDHERWFIHPYGSVFEHITIASYGAEGAPERFDTGYNYANEAGYHYGGSIRIAPGETRTVLFQFDSRFYISPLRFTVDPADLKLQKLEQENILLVMLLAVGLTLAIYNLFIFVGSRQRMYLWYALATLSYIWGWAHVYGFIEHVTGNLYPQWLMTPYLIGNAFSCWFVIDFLELKKESPRLRRVLQINALLSLAVSPLAYTDPGHGVLLASAATSITLMIGLYTGLLAWHRGYRPAIYFVFAFLAVLLPNMMGNLINFGLIPSGVFNAYLWGLIGVNLDSLLLALALADRVEWLERERKNALQLALDAQTERLEATQRHEAELETKVARRTAELAAEIARHGETIEILRASEAELTQYAYHDVLTELPNRRAFYKHLLRTIAQARRSNACFALALLDLDRVKEINDRLGHDAGDALLAASAGRLRENMRSGDMVARLGGDEFAVVLAMPIGTIEANAALDRLLIALREPIFYKGHTLQTSGSLGLAWFPRDGDNAELLFKSADDALYLAKAAGRGCWREATTLV